MFKIILLSRLCYRKQILQEVSNTSDLSSEKFREIHKRIESCIDAIKPNEEYKDFTEKYK